HVRASAGDLKEAASAKVEDIRQTVGQKQMNFGRRRKRRLKSSEEGRRPPVLMSARRRKVGRLKAKPTFATTRPRPLDCFRSWASIGFPVAKMIHEFRSFAWN